jgi:putative transposase
MLNAEQFENWCQLNDINKAAKVRILDIRFKEPERKVSGGQKNVHGFYPSVKMGKTIQFESNKVEFPGIYQMEHDSQVLEYYDQPDRMMLKYTTKDGKPIGHGHTPDYFVINNESAGWEEWKTEEELIELSELNPNRYCKDEFGVWRCPPGEEVATKLGLYYRVRSSGDINWNLHRNLIFLQDFMGESIVRVTKETKETIIKLVTDHQGITLNDLITFILEREILVDDLYGMVVMGDIFINLSVYPLGEAEYAKVYNSEQTALAHDRFAQESEGAFQFTPVILEVGKDILWDQVRWKIINVGEPDITLLREDGETTRLPQEHFEGFMREGKITGPVEVEKDEIEAKALAIFQSAGPDDYELANYRYEIITQFEQGELSKDCKVPLRTIRDWRKKFNDALMHFNNGYIGLLPKDKSKGNRIPRLSPKVYKIIYEAIDDKIKNVIKPKYLSVWGDVCLSCEEIGQQPPTYKTFTLLINQVPTVELVRSREGRRAAYQYEHPFMELDRTTPRHGDRPFEIAHIDHTQLDIELVCSKTGKVLGRPWLTLMTDAFTRKILAIYLTYDPPSYRSCMMIMRECVHRHLRLPDTIIVDGGKEFQSVYFDSLLAIYKCTKKVRPPAQARFGSVCERLFGTTNTQILYNLLGNTQSTKKVRQMSKEVNPSLNAVWTMSALYRLLSEYVYETYDTKEHPALFCSPREAFDRGIQRSGVRSKRRIAYDETFKMLTLPTTKKGTAEVDGRLGVKINYIYYSCTRLRSPDVVKKQVPVRYDPYDMGTAYVYVKGKWHACISEYYAILKGRTEKEVNFATQEIRKRHNQHQKSLMVNAKKIAELLREARNEELELQKMKDAENKVVLHVIDGGKSKSSSYELTQEVPLKAVGSEFVPPNEAMLIDPESFEGYGDF